MNITKLLPNDRTKVWIIDPRTDVHRYGDRMGVSKLIRTTDSIKIYMKEMLTLYPGTGSVLLNDFEIGNTIYVTYCEAGDPSIFANNEPILALKNCSFVKSWIYNPVVLQPQDVGCTELFLVAESLDFEWREK